MPTYRDNEDPRDARNRCCLGCCHIRTGAMSVAIFLIAQSILSLIYLWASHAKDASLFVSTGILILMIGASSVAIWGIHVNRSWPMILMFIMLGVMILGCVYLAVTSGIATGLLGNCEGVRNRENSTCGVMKIVLIVLLVVSVAYLILYVWFTYIFARVKAFIELSVAGNNEMQRGYERQGQTQWGKTEPPAVSAAYLAKGKDEPPPQYYP